MESSPPHPAHLTTVARSNDLGRFYGRIEGATHLLAIGGAGTRQVRASAPLEGSTIIDLNISATALHHQLWPPQTRALMGCRYALHHQTLTLTGHHRVYPR
jgi:hypothetical protein